MQSAKSLASSSSKTLLLSAQRSAAGNGLREVRPALLEQWGNAQSEEIAIVGIILIAFIFNPA
jgi:hypothetical protein